MGGEHGVGGDHAGCTADTAGDLDPLVGDLSLVAALKRAALKRAAFFLVPFRTSGVGGLLQRRIGMTTAEDLALRIQIVNDEQDDIQNLGIAQVLFVAVEGRKVGDAVLLQHIQKLQLGACQFSLDPIHLACKADVDVRVGTGKDEQLIREKEVGFHGEVVGLGANETGDGEAHGAVAVVDDLELALTTGALELDHIRRQIEKSDGAQDSASAVGATVGHGGALFVQYHNGFLPAQSGPPDQGRPLGA